MTDLKICSKCGVEKSVEEFRKGRNQCKLCQSEHNKEYRKEHYINNKEYYKEYRKEYQINNKEKLKEIHEEYYIKHKDSLKEQFKEYYIKHKDEILEYQKEYRINNKDEILEYRKEYASDLKEGYVVSNIRRQTGMTKEEIYANPELIEAKKNVIKIKRLLKQIKTKTNDTINEFNTAKQ